MTNIENNTDKRSQQLSTATGLTTQSAKEEAFNKFQHLVKNLLKNLENHFLELM